MIDHFQKFIGRADILSVRMEKHHEFVPGSRQEQTRNVLFTINAILNPKTTFHLPVVASVLVLHFRLLPRSFGLLSARSAVFFDYF